jgi:hypothetical protein
VLRGTRGGRGSCEGVEDDAFGAVIDEIAINMAVAGLFISLNAIKNIVIVEFF